jgi:DNA-binding NarL/FixJ family response regulator
MRTQRIASPERPSKLTPRQRDVAALLVGTGLSYKQIALKLQVREGTMRTHAEHVYRAFGVHSRAELTVALQPWSDVLPGGSLPVLDHAQGVERR